jgi:hypothetical protein
MATTRSPAPIRRRAAEAVAAKVAVMTGPIISMEAMTDMVVETTEENPGLRKITASNTRRKRETITKALSSLFSHKK